MNYAFIYPPHMGGKWKSDIKIDGDTNKYTPKKK